MDIETLLYRAAGDRICEIRFAADKALTQRLLNMSVARLPPVQASERTTRQRYKKMKNETEKWGKKIPTEAMRPRGFFIMFPVGLS